MMDAKKPIEDYLKIRKDDDINLLEEVRNIFIQSGLTSKISTFNKHQFILQAENKIPSVQRYFLNRYFNIQLSYVANSFNARYNLINDGDFEYWIKLFKENVLPILIDNDLPPSS